MGCHVFSCRSLLLSTTVLNDIPLLYFLLGVNAHTSLVNMYQWLDSVFNE